MKRKSSYNSSPKKKFRSQLSINCIENLSNELFYEIFDYLDVYNIFQAFSNLNYRFHQLLHHSSLLFKIRYSSSKDVNMNIYNQIMQFNKHQILSIDGLTLKNKDPIISILPIDFSFNHLEYLILDLVQPKILYSLLPKLINLPRLRSLTINTFNIIKDLGEIYQFIFRIPKLKFFKFFANEYRRRVMSISLPTAATNQISSIEHLNIDHPFTFTELSSILSYTHRLHRLNLCNESIMKSNSEMSLPLNLSNLTYISIFMYDLEFDRFENLISQISSKLKVLHLVGSPDDPTYLNADRWERFISQNLPQLEEFKFQYYKETIDRNKSSIKLARRNEFTSPFWIARKWVLSVRVITKLIIYSIGSYRKRWYEYAQPPIIDSSLELSKSAQLILTDLSNYYFKNSLTRCIISIFSVTQIYHLAIEGSIREGTLILLLCHLSQLMSLKIDLLLWEELTDDLGDGMRGMSDESKITKMCLEEVYDLDEVDFLMALSYRLHYLQINSLHDINIELLIHEILTRTNARWNENLRFLCIGIPTADDQLIEKLKEIIDSEGLVDYTINRVMDKIYLQWR